MTTAMTTSINELRAEYRRMRDAGRFIFGRDWDDAVVSKLAGRGINPSNATPTDWVEAAGSATLTCEKCRGSGTQDMDDMFRNRSHTLHSIVQACR